MQAEAEVVVVGAGPSGGICALELASEGVEVVLLEKEGIPRFKLCAGGLSIRARRLVGLQIGDSVLNEIDAFELLGRHRSRLRKQMGECFGWIVDRARFDAIIVGEAKKAGCLVRERSAVVEIVQRGGVVDVRCEDASRYRARALVGADGSKSNIRRTIGLRPLRRRGLTVMMQAAATNQQAVDFRTIRFDFGVVPRGYVWVFPRGDRFSVGAMSTTGRLPKAKRQVLEYIRSEARFGPEAEVSFLGGSLVPYWSGEKQFGRDNVVLVGDAAGLVDSFLGEGLTWAVMTGRLAARAILGLKTGSAGYDSLHNEYGRLLAEHVLPELTRSRWVKRIAYRCPELVFWALKRLVADTEQVMRLAESETSYAGLMAGLARQFLKGKAGRRRPPRSSG